MPLLPSLRHAAALFLFSAAALAAVPADAMTTNPVESSYAAVLRHINPHLPLAQARAYAASIVKDATKTHIDPRFLMSIVTVESHWEANAISRVGARGLGQLMPHTAAVLGVNPRVPSENLRGTANYLQKLMATFAGHKNAMQLAIAGYNAGPKAVEKYHGVPPYAETQTYVVRVLHIWDALRGRVGRALAGASAVAVRPRVTPDEAQWVSGVERVVPAKPATTHTWTPATGTSDTTPAAADPATTTTVPNTTTNATDPATDPATAPATTPTN
jgi:hypothetical protein